MPPARPLPSAARSARTLCVRRLAGSLFVALAIFGASTARADDRSGESAPTPPPAEAPATRPAAGDWEGRLLGTLDRIDPGEPS
jgi:hypothetical protein